MAKGMNRPLHHPSKLEVALTRWGRSFILEPITPALRLNAGALNVWPFMVQMPRVTTALIVVTCAFSAASSPLQHYAHFNLHGLLRATPNWLETWQIWRPFTANLVHIFGLPHLILNMVGLMLAGPAVEAAVRPRLFLLLYVASGFVGWTAQSAIAQGGSGASPAVVGVFAALLANGYAHRDQPSGVRQIIRASILSVLWLASGPILNGTSVLGLGRIQIADYSHLGGYLTGLGISSVVLGFHSWQTRGMNERA